MMDVSGAGNKLQRSIHSGEEVHCWGEGHLIDNAGFRYSLQRAFPSRPFIRPGIIKWFSRGGCGPRRHEGIRVRNSFEGQFTAEAKASVCFLQRERERRRKEGREWTPARS